MSDKLRREIEEVQQYEFYLTERIQAKFDEMGIEADPKLARAIYSVVYGRDATEAPEHAELLDAGFKGAWHRNCQRVYDWMVAQSPDTWKATMVRLYELKGEGPPDRIEDCAEWLAVPAEQDRELIELVCWIYTVQQLVGEALGTEPTIPAKIYHELARSMHEGWQV
jgi:hypothetical protein